MFAAVPSVPHHDPMARIGWLRRAAVHLSHMRGVAFLIDKLPERLVALYDEDRRVLVVRIDSSLEQQAWAVEKVLIRHDVDPRAFDEHPPTAPILRLIPSPRDAERR